MARFTSGEVMTDKRVAKLLERDTGGYPVAADWTLFGRVGDRVGIEAVETRSGPVREKFTGQVRRALLRLAADGTLFKVGAEYYSPQAFELILSRQRAVPGALEVRFDLTAALLDEFKTLPGDGTAKRDLELTHVPCGEHLCDVEPGGTMTELLSVVAAHVCERTSTP